MPDAAQGALVIFHDIAPGAERLVTEWYNREHHAERARIPGFLGARRYVALIGSPQLFNLYPVRDASVLRSQAYLDCVNRPSEASLRAIPNCRGMIRTVCTSRYKWGDGMGGFAGTWRLSAAPAKERDLMDWLSGRALPALSEAPGVVSADLLQGDPAVSGLASSERALRPDQRPPASLIAVITATSAEAIRAVHSEALRDEALRTHGAADPIEAGVYQLSFAI